MNLANIQTKEVRPEEWAEIYNRNHPPIAVAEVKEAPHKNLQRPGLLKQFLIYFTRDIKSKWANTSMSPDSS